MKNLLVNAGFNPTEEQLKQFDTYFNMLVEWNEKMNLTAITEKKEVYIKHFIDSLHLSNVKELKGRTLLDVGAGAGFPSIPMKIMNPELDVTIIDALEKRIKFLTQLSEELDIDVHLVHGRAEVYAKKNRESYDFVTARAVARLNVLLELCVPFVKEQGMFVAYKSSSTDELEETKAAQEILGVRLTNTHTYSLPEVTDEHMLCFFEKFKETPLKYPRNFNKIKKQPL